jgi:hypothetical protein
MAAILICGATLATGAGRPSGRATVAVHLVPEGVRAVIRLDRAVTRLALDDGDVERMEDVDVLTPGVTWSNDGAALVAEQSFRRVDVLVKPAARERDAKYPAFFRVGTGGVLYGPALKPGDDWRTRLTVTTAHGQIRLPAGTPNIDSSLYIGPAAYVTHGEDAELIVSPDTPTLLRERVTGILATALRTYSTHLGVPLSTRPIAVLAQGGGGLGFRGDVTPGPFMALRFYGPSRQQTSEASASDVTRFVMHEVFHFWNGSLVHNAADAPAWLHEGGAEYAALLASMEAGALDDAGMRDELATALTRCRRALENAGDVGLNDLQELSSDVRYPCGVVIQWATSLGAERAGHGGFFRIWAHMIVAAQARTSRTFTLGDFYAGAGIDPAAPPEPIRLLTVAHGPNRWGKLEAALRALDVELGTAPNPATRRATLIQHLLGQICRSGSRGFYTEPNRIRLQTNPTCTLIPDNSILDRVEGGDVMAMDEKTYDTVRARCAAKEDVHIELDGNRDVAIPCRRDLPPPRDAYLVTRWH